MAEAWAALCRQREAAGEAAAEAAPAAQARVDRRNASDAKRRRAEERQHGGKRSRAVPAARDRADDASDAKRRRRAGERQHGGKRSRRP